MMKTMTHIRFFLLTALLLSASTTAFGQSKKWNVRVSLNGAFNGFSHGTQLDGGGEDFDSDWRMFSYGASAEVAYALSRKSELTLGLTYMQLRGTQHVTLDFPPFTHTDRAENKNLFTIPLLYRFRFWKYFYLDGGLYLDILSREPYWNAFGQHHAHPYYVMMGGGVGVGAEYVFPFGLYATLHPNVRITTWGDDKPVLGYSGVTLQVGYRF
jgi:hypothetical protein